VSENSVGNPRFGCFDAKADQNRPVEAPWTAFGLKPELELWACKPLGVGESLNQYSKWKFRLRRAAIKAEVNKWAGLFESTTAIIWADR